MASERASQQAFLGVSALLFAASAALTIVWCASMSAMGEMPMPGGWTMSMAWMRMPGQTWPGAAASLGRRQQRYAKLHSFLEDAVVSRGYQILGSAIPAQNVQEIEK
jgi:hypothetical protein